MDPAGVDAGARADPPAAPLGPTRRRGLRAREPRDALEAAPRRNVARKVLFGLVVLMFLMRVNSLRRPTAPELAADCDRPAFKLSAESIEQAKPVTYTIVGPEGRRYVLGVDTVTFTQRAHGWDAVAKPGYEKTSLVAAGVEPMKGCSRSGVFSTPIPIGGHTVTLYELTDAGAVFVEEQSLEVTAP